MRNRIVIALLALVALRSVGQQDEVIRPLMITDHGEIVNATHQRIAERVAASNLLVRSVDADYLQAVAAGTGAVLLVNSTYTQAVARAAMLTTGAVLKTDATYTGAVARAMSATASSYTNVFLSGVDTHTLIVIDGKITSWIITPP